MAPHSTLLPNRCLSLFLACCSSFALVCFAFPTAHAGTTWDGGGNATTNIDTSTNWNDDINPLLTAGNQTLTFGTGGSTATINTDVNVAGIVINRAANFEIANGAGNLTIGTGGITVTLPNTTARTHTISESNLILSGSQTWSVTNNTGAAALNVSSTISGVNTTLTKTGSGTLTLSGNNSFSGAVYATAGYLNVNHNNALGANSGTVFTEGFGNANAVRLNGGVTVTGKTLRMNGLGLSSEGQLVVNDGTTNTWAGLIDVRNTTRIGIAANANSRLNLTGGITANGNQTFSLMNKAGIVSVTGSAINLGSGGTLQILASGSGITRLGVAAGASNWGLTRVDFGGQLITDVANALAANAVLSLGSGSDSVSRSGSLDLNGFNQTVGGLRSGNVAGGETTSNGTRTITSASAATLTVNETSTNLYDGTITGAVALTKNGAGNLTLSGNNTYTGATTVNAGTLLTGAADRISDSSAVTVASGATFQLGGNETVASIAGAGNYSIAGFTLTVGGDNTSTTVSGNITGASGALTKTGSGTLTLSGANTYNGTTTISAGALVFQNKATRTGGSAVSATATGTVGLGVGGGGVTDYSDADVASLFNSTLSGFTLNAASGVAIDTTAGNFTQSTALTAARALTKLGSNTLTLSGANTYTGSTTVTVGTLSTSAADRISDSSAITVASGATFLLGGNETVASIAGAGNYSIAGFTLTAGGDNTSTTVSGNITGASGTLTKTGSGTLTLNGTNTYTGTTTVNAGTLTISGGAAIADSGTVTLANASGVAFNVNASETIGSLQGGGATGGNVTIASGQTLTVAEANNNTFGGSLQGAGNFTKSGLGTLTLNGANTNSGAVSVTGGTVLLSGANALSGSTSLLGAASSTTISLADGVGRTITLSTGNLSLSSATMVFELGSTSDRLTLTSGAVTLSGTNTISLANLGSFTAGTYTLISAASGLNGGTWSLNSAGGPTGFTYTLSNSSTTLSLIATASSNNFFWTGNASTNWSGNNFSATDGGASTLSAGNFSATSDLIFAAAGASNLSTTMNSNYTVNSLAITSPGVSIGGANTLAVNSTSSSAIAVSASSGNTTISANLAGASAGLTKTNSGTLILSGSNSYNGTTTVSGGVLNIQHANALGSTANGTTVATGAALQLQGGITVGAEALSLSGIGVSADGALRNLSSNNIYGGAITLATTTRINSDSGLLTLSGGISGTQDLTVGGAGNTTISNTIATSTGTLTKDGLGTLTLSASNTYTGATTINAGTLSIATITNGGVAGALGNSTNAASNLVLSGGTLEYTGSANGSTNRDFTLTAGTTSGISVTNSTVSLTISGNAASTNGALTKSGAGTLTLTGNNTYTGTTTINAGTLLVDSSGRLGGGSYAGNIVNNGTFTYNGSNSQTLSGFISGGGTFIKNNSSTLTLSGNNSFTGAVYAVAGYLNVNHNNALGANSGTVYTEGYGVNTAVRLNGGVTVTGKTLRMSGAGLSSEGQLVVNDGTTNTWAGLIDVRNTTRIGIAANAASRLNLTGGITANGSQTLTLIAKAGTISVTGLAINLGSSGTLQIVSGVSRLGVAAGASNWGLTRVDSGGQLVTDVANALAANAVLALGASGDGASSSLDMNGFNQTVGGLRTGNVAGGEATGGLSRTITSASAATLTVNETSTNLYDGTITGAVALTKNGTGNLTLSGNNTYTGATTVNAGTLLLSGNGTLGTSTISISGGTLDMGGKSLTNTFGSLTGGTLSNGTLTNNGGNYDLQSGTVSAILAGTNGVNKTSSGTVTLSNANTYNGTTTVSNGTLLLSGNGTLGTSTISISGGTLDMGGKSLTNTFGSLTGGTLSNGTLTNNGGNYDLQNGTVSAILAGTNGVSKTTSGTVTLSNANNYSGSTSVAGGTLLLSSAGTLGTSTISISGGTLDMGGKSLSNTFGSLTGGTLSNGTLTNNGGNYDLQSGTVSAVLTGTNGVNKTTSGTVTLSNANTYNGTTTVNSGTLTAAAAGALGNTSKVFLNNGGSLLVTTDDAIGTNTAVELNGGRLAVNGTFDESVGALTLSANSVIDFSGFVGTLRFSGVTSWASGANLAIWNWSGVPRYGDPVNNYLTPSNLVFTNNSTLSSNLANISFYSDSGTTSIGSGFERGFTGGGTEIIAVPETETYITGVLLLLGFTFYQIRLARHGQGLLSRLTFLQRRKC